MTQSDALLDERPFLRWYQISDRKRISYIICLYIRERRKKKKVVTKEEREGGVRQILGGAWSKDVPRVAERGVVKKKILKVNIERFILESGKRGKSSLGRVMVFFFCRG